MASSQSMGPYNLLDSPGWVEVTLPYKENRNEDEVQANREYDGPMPTWEIWDWLEANVPDMHDDVNGSVGWWRTRSIFQFFFRDLKTARAFTLRFSGKPYVA